jgi:hypothetical protein
MKRLLGCFGTLLLLVVVVVGPILYLARRDYNHQHPLRVSLGSDFEAIQNIIPMLDKGAETNPLRASGKAIILKKMSDQAVFSLGNQLRSKWDPPVEIDPVTWKLPDALQATADDIRLRRPVTIFVVVDSSKLIGQYGGAVDATNAAEITNRVSVFQWPDAAPVYAKDFHLVPPGSIHPGDHVDYRPPSGEVEYQTWILKTMGARK